MCSFNIQFVNILNRKHNLHDVLYLTLEIKWLVIV